MTLTRFGKILASLGLTAVGGALGYLIPTLEEGHIPTTEAQWRGLGLVALLVGLATLLPSPMTKTEGQ